MISAAHEPQYVTETCFGHFNSDSTACVMLCPMREKCNNTGLHFKATRCQTRSDGRIIIMRLSITLKPLPMPQNQIFKE